MILKYIKSIYYKYYKYHIISSFGKQGKVHRNPCLSIYFIWLKGNNNVVNSLNITV